jgi:hypothetical protein
LPHSEKAEEETDNDVQDGEYEGFYGSSDQSKFVAFSEKHAVDIGLDSEEEKEERDFEKCRYPTGDAGRSHETVPPPERFSLSFIFHEGSPKLIQAVATLKGFGPEFADSSRSGMLDGGEPAFEV